MKQPVYSLLVIVYAALLASSGGTATAQPAAKVPDNVELLRNVPFGKGGSQVLTMHILRPKTLPKAPMPVLVYIHGSAWMRDNKDLAIGRLIATAQQGYFGATIQVRTSGEAVFPAPLEDAKCAIRFLRAKAKDYHIDPNRIGVWGDSSGGHLSALVGLTAGAKELDGQGGWADFSSRVQAVCSMCPAVGFLAADWPERHNTGPNGPAFRLLGGDPRKDKRELARKASPLTYITKASPPFFIVHGDNDTTVPFSQGQLLYDALKKAGVEATLYTVKGGNHASVHQQDQTVVKQFFDKHLQPSRETDAQSPASATAAGTAGAPKGGKVAGILLEKKDNWITVKADGETEPIKYVLGKGADKRLADAFKVVFNASRVQLTYKTVDGERQLVSIQRQILKKAGTITGLVVKVHDDFWVEVKPKVGLADAFAPGVTDFKDKAFMDTLKSLKPGDSVTITYNTDFERNRIQSLRINSRAK
jgi:acetyl esterase/lipase